MRWNIKRHPTIGDERTVIRFAFLPVQCDHIYVVWLERFQEVQVYSSVTKRMPESKLTYTDFEWRAVSRKPL